jgi:hypothetical protein
VPAPAQKPTLPWWHSPEGAARAAPRAPPARRLHARVRRQWKGHHAHHSGYNKSALNTPTACKVPTDAESPTKVPLNLKEPAVCPGSDAPMVSMPEDAAMVSSRVAPSSVDRTNE